MLLFFFAQGKSDWLRPTVPPINRGTIQYTQERSIMAELAEVLANLQKTNEGTILGLQAVAEQLSKMNSASEQQEALQKEKETKNEYNTMVKSIAGDVFKLVRKQLEDLGGDETKNVGGKSKAAGSGPDTTEESKKEALKNPTEHGAQRTIQAMSKQGMPNPEWDEEEDDELGEKEYGLEETPPIDEAEDEMPMGEDEELSDKEIRYMARMIKELQKSNKGMKRQFAEMQKGQEDRIQEETEKRLRKAGFREERSLVGPRLVKKEMGVDGVPIVKSEEASSPMQIAKQLESLSWSDLASLRERTLSGQFEGVPRELLPRQ